MDGDRFDHLTRHLATGVTRRRVVKTGAKLAYVAPLVAATSHLGIGSAAAACAPASMVCPPGTTDAGGGCASCPPGYRLRSQGDCKETNGPGTRSASYSAKVCPGSSGGGSLSL